MRRELLAGTAIVGIALNVGGVAKAQTVVTVSQTGSACTANPVNFTDLHTALTASNVKDNYATPIDIQMCPGTYTTGGPIDFNGTLEGMGTTAADVDIVVNSAGAQYYLSVGDELSAYPGVTAEIKNIQLDGTISTGGKASRLVQVIAGGFVRFDNVNFVNGQDGILTAGWSQYARDGSGVIMVCSSHFTNMGSDAGPSHALYLQFGIDVVGYIGTLTINGQPYTCPPNSFSEVNYGYAAKFRPGGTRGVGYFEGNNASLNFDVSSSGAVQDGEGGTVHIIGNAMTLGPLTGTNNNPSQFLQYGGTLGENEPEAGLIQGNTFITNGVSQHVTIVSSFDDTTNITLAGNTLPLADQIAATGPILGMGSVGAGNVYADGTPVPESVNNTNFYGMQIAADFRGTSDPQSVTVPKGELAWGGNGVLTATAGGIGGAVIGGPGGLILNSGTVDTWAFSDPNSPADTFNITAGTYQIYAHGKDETFNMGSCPGDTNPLDIFPGVTATINTMQPETGRFGCAVYQMGGTVTLNADGVSGTNSSGNTAQVWPGATFIETGIDGRPGWIGQDGTIIAQALTIQGATGVVPQVFSFEIDGGWINANPDLTIATGTGSITAINGMDITSYDNGPSGYPTITLKDTAVEKYTINANGGALIYPGIDEITVGGSARQSGPPDVPISVHVQSAAAGSSVNGGFGALSLYLDGPGTLKANTANTDAQPIYVEVDANGTGSLEVQQWHANDIAASAIGQPLSQTNVGANEIAVFSNGGTVQFDGVRTPVNFGTIAGAPLAFTPVAGLVAPLSPGSAVGTISGGTPPYASSDTMDFSISGSTLETAGTLGAGSYPTTITDSGP